MNTDNSRGLSLGDILVVDDEETNIELFEEFLTEAGYQIRTAGDGQTALSSVQAKLPDLILLDYKMPGMDGIEVCTRLKGDPATKDIPIIFLSALGETDIKVQALEAGAADYISKPFGLSEVLARINTHLKISRLQAEMAAQAKQLIAESEERKRAELRLQESTDRFRELFERAPLAYQSLDENGCFIEVNQTWLEELGYTRDEVIGRSFGDFLHPDWQDHFKENFPRFKEVGEILGVEFEMVRKDGSLILMAINGRIGRKPDGSFQQTHCVLQDITAQKQAEQKAVRFNRVLEGSLNEIYIFDAETFHFVEVNRGARENLGYTIEELRELTPLDLKPEITSESFAKLIAPLQAGTQETIKFNAIHQRKDGTQYPVEIYLQLISDDRPVFIAIIRDITEARKAEETLRKSETLHSKMMANIGDVIVIIDKDGINRYKSPNIERWFGWKPEDLIGKETLEQVHPDDLEAASETLAAMMSEPNAACILECRYRCKDGSFKWIEFIGVNLLHDPDIQGVLGNYSDITARKQAAEEKEKLEEQLRQSQKMEAVGTMAGGIAHDFNNILAIILGNAEMAIDDIPPENPARLNIKEVLIASSRAKDLVRQILAFSRKEKSELIPIRPQALISETLKLLRSTTPTTIDIVPEISRDCGTIMADPTQLHQLTMNLFSNAVHAMDEKGVVTVSLEAVDVGREFFDKTSLVRTFTQEAPGPYIKFSIADAGSGMSRKMIERIFDPFYTTKELGRGTGMGLSVVHGIVESHSGFMTVDSEVGKGSTFSVFLPAANVAEETAEVENATHLQTGTERILVVDDEEGLVEMAKRMLEGLGYKVTTESNSVRALEIFKVDPDQFDLVMTDQSMPNMSGSELTAEILKIRSDIPVILCTGFSNKVSAENAGEKGLSRYIDKPYSKKMLSVAVREVLDGKA